MRPQLIGDEIHMDAQLVGILVPHAAPGPATDFRDFLDDAILPDEEAMDDAKDSSAAEAFSEAIVSVEELVNELPLIGGMVPITAVLAAIQTVKDNA